MDDLIRFLDMGGYGRFIWPAYGMTILAMIALAAGSLCALHRHRRELTALQNIPSQTGRDTL
ncbi:MAG: heme exporter protein CcmD [Rhodospirillaceae bacterium]|nr:heme exporter protein CcmD [Rhodospirillaceae bacterium]